MGVLLALSGSVSCRAPAPVPVVPAVSESVPSDSADVCAGTTVFEASAPATQPRHRDAQFWIQAATMDPDVEVMSREQIDATNAIYSRNEELFRDPLQLSAADDATIRARWEQRSQWMRGKIDAGHYLEQTSGAMARATARMDGAKPHAEFHVITHESALWCVPSMEGILSQAKDAAFDRNRCTGLHPGELVLATHAVDGEPWVHVEAGHSDGWLHAPQWTPPLARDEAHAFAHGTPRAYVVQETTPDAGGVDLRIGTSFPVSKTSDGPSTLNVPASTGLQARPLDDTQLAPGPLPLTKRRLLELAFSRLGDAYGWGGYRGNRDCSRFVHDMLETFGVLMARNSAAQALMGAKNIDLRGMTDPDKRQEITRLDARNVVLLYMPGHIMLYLGRDGDRHFALSSLSEYMRPCQGGGAQTVRLDRVEVTSLELGRGTPRTSFLERLTTAVVFGPG
jgi:hypothetical protein